jgi:hypothetical protein
VSYAKIQSVNIDAMTTKQSGPTPGPLLQNIFGVNLL